MRIRDALTLPVMAMSGLFALGANAQTGQITDLAYTRPHKLVEIEPGRRLNLNCAGQGSPTVILEGGITMALVTWGLVQPAIARDTRTCSYDRAGLGFSDASPRATNAANNNDDLHRLLAAARIAPPYVFVSASAGGLYTRRYIQTYPGEVVGLVLVDSSHEDQDEMFRTTAPRSYTQQEWDNAFLDVSLAKRRTCIAAAKAGTITPGSDLFKDCIFHADQLGAAVQQSEDQRELTRAFQSTQHSEEESLTRATAQQVRTLPRSLGDLPLIVLSRDRFPPPPDATPELLNRMEVRYQKWLGLARDLASLSTRGQQRVVAGAGHDIELDRPQAVIDATREVLAAARDHHARVAGP